MGATVAREHTSFNFRVEWSMNAVCSFETSVPICQTIRCHNLEDHNMDWLYHKNFKIMYKASAVFYVKWL